MVGRNYKSSYTKFLGLNQMNVIMIPIDTLSDDVIYSIFFIRHSILHYLEFKKTKALFVDVKLDEAVFLLG